MSLIRVLTVLLGATLLLGACGEGDGTALPRRSVARLKITDAPFPYDSVQSVNVHVVRVEGSTSSDTLAPRQWVTFVEPRETINLLDYQQGATKLLGEGDIPADEYRGVRLVLDASRSSIVHVDGRSVPVEWGATGEFTINNTVQTGINVPQEGATDIVIDFDVGRSFNAQLADDSSRFISYQFIPWTRAVSEAATGSISGRVMCQTPSGPVAVKNAVLYAWLGGTPSGFLLRATGRTTASGDYVIAYLLPEALTVEALPQPSSGCGGAERTVTVIRGQTTAGQDFLLPDLP